MMGEDGSGGGPSGNRASERDAAGGQDALRKSQGPPEAYNDLNAALRFSWGLIARGVADRKSAFHTPVVATTGPEGEPDVRTVVLRAADLDAWTLRFHTDRRSGKCAALAANPRIAIHFYCARAKIQLRLRGLATVHADDAIADLAWGHSRPMSRACYGQSHAPGAMIDDPALGTASDALGETFGRTNFAAVVVAVGRLEWLYLDFAGHRRAMFDRDAQGAVTAQWVAP